jgi:hypothetical protein
MAQVVREKCLRLYASHDSAENVGDGGSEQGQYDNNDHCDEDKDQRVFDEALTLIVFESKHD